MLCWKGKVLESRKAMLWSGFGYQFTMQHKTLSRNWTRKELTTKTFFLFLMQDLTVVIQAGLKLMIFYPQSSECQNCRHVPPCPAHKTLAYLDSKMWLDLKVTNVMLLNSLKTVKIRIQYFSSKSIMRFPFLFINGRTEANPKAKVLNTCE
jgi:hypothetical protein